MAKQFSWLERWNHNPNVVGSSPTFANAGVTQLVRVFACRAKGHGFESRYPRFI